MLNFLAAKWYPFLFDTEDITNLMRSVFFWVAIVVIVASALVIFLAKNPKITKICLIADVVIALGTIGLFMTLGFMEDGIVPILFYPLLALVVLIAVSAVLLVLKVQNAPVISAGLVGAGLVAVLVCMAIYFASGEAEDMNWVSVDLMENIGLYVSTVVLVAIVAGLGVFCGKDDKKGFDSKSITYAAICIALSFALSYIRIVKLPQGGSVTIASLLPLMIYSYMFGTKKGVFAGFIYGILQAVQDPWIVHPAQFLLDYPIAFAAIGLAGIFAGKDFLPQIKFVAGGIVASVLRYAAHIFSGAFAFSEYAGDEGAWVYTLTYNSFVFVDIAIVLVVGAIIFSMPSVNKEIERVRLAK